MKLNIQLFADGKVIIGTELDTSGFEDGLDNMENESKLSKVIKSIKSKFTEIGTSMNNAIKKAGTGIASIGKKVASVGSIIIKTMGKVLASAIGFGAALVAALGIVALLALGFLALQEAFSQVAEENKKLKADIQYLIFAIKTALKPVIDAIAGVIVKIISFIITIVKYAMALANVIAGKNLFDKASVEAFKKSMKDASKNSDKVAKNSAKTTKELQKQLAGFDEMNVLSKNVGASGGGGGIGTTKDEIPTPTFDVTNLEEYESKIKKVFNEIKTKVGEVWDFILNTSHNDAEKYLKENDKVWGTLKLGMFDWLHGISNIVSGFYDVWSGIFDFLIGLFTDDDEKIKKGVEKMKKGVLKILEGLWSVLRSQPEMIWGIIKGIGTKIWDGVKTKVKNIKDKIKEVWKQIKDDFKESFWKGIANIFIRIINKAIGFINDKFSFTIGHKTAVILKALGIDVSEGKHQILTIPKIPTLAKGGVINMPGRGVAIGGERGQEGVIPLTDSQQMALLGEAIGKYINLSATIPVYVGSRQVAREMRKIELQDAFAGNR